MCLCSHMDIMKCCGISKAGVTLPVISACVWKNLGGACGISADIPLSEDELERQREKIRKGTLVVRDREHPLAEDLITDKVVVVDPQLPVLTKVSCLVDALNMGGSFGLFEKLWAQFVLTVGPVSTEVALTRSDDLVGSVDFGNHFVSFLIHIVVLLLVNHRYWNAAPISAARGCLGEGSPLLHL